MRVLFRCDASAVRGSGHLMRCLSVAEELRRRGSEAVFVCRQEAAGYGDYVQEQGHQFLLLSESDPDLKNPEKIWSDDLQAEDVGACQALLKQSNIPTPFDWVVVDHYSLSTAWETKARGTLGQKLMVIDDLARLHHCDMLLDHNCYVGAQNRYDGKVSEDTTCLLGGQYAMLRQEFADARTRVMPPQAQVKNVLIFMGSGDQAGVTWQIATALKPLAESDNLHIHIVASATNPHHKDLTTLAGNNAHYTLHQNARMSDLMLETDIAFGAGGSATWEFLCLGVPLFMITYAPNQVQVAEDTHTQGLARYLGNYDPQATKGWAETIRDGFQSLAHDLGARQNMHTKAMEAVNPHGCQNIIEALQKTL